MAPKPKDVVWRIRLSEDEMTLLQEAATKQDRRPATVAREVLVRWAKRTLAA